MTVMIVSPHREWLSILQMPAAGRGKVVQASQCNAVHLHWHGTCTCVSVWCISTARTFCMVFLLSFPVYNISVLHQNEGLLGNPYLTPKRFPENRILKGHGDGFPILSSLPGKDWIYHCQLVPFCRDGFSMHPCQQKRIDRSSPLGPDWPILSLMKNEHPSSSTGHLACF